MFKQETGIVWPEFWILWNELTLSPLHFQMLQFMCWIQTENILVSFVIDIADSFLGENGEITYRNSHNISVKMTRIYSLRSVFLPVSFFASFGLKSRFIAARQAQPISGSYKVLKFNRFLITTVATQCTFRLWLKVGRERGTWDAGTCPRGRETRGRGTRGCKDSGGRGHGAARTRGRARRKRWDSGTRGRD